MIMLCSRPSYPPIRIMRVGVQYLEAQLILGTLNPAHRISKDVHYLDRYHHLLGQVYMQNHH